MRALGLALMLGVAAARMQAAQMNELRLEYSNPNLAPAQWTLVMWPDGRAHFHAERGTAKDPDKDQASMEPAVIDRDVQVSGEFAGRMFAMIEQHPPQAGQCENRSKVAFQGLKTLQFRGPDGEQSCTFNYAKERVVGEVADELVSVAATLIEGERLRMIWQHDPLGLDKQIQFMMEAAADGRLQQICTIRETLAQLAADPGVMERVRKRAGKLSQCNR